MDCNRQNHIKNNANEFAKEIAKLDCLGDLLFELRNFIGEDILDQINNFESTTTNKARLLLHNIYSSTEETIDEFVKVLFKNNCISLAKEIDPEMTSELVNRNMYIAGAEPLPYNMPLTPVLKIDPGSPENFQNIARGFNCKFEIAVKYSSTIFGPDTETYKNSSQPRGFVFIANYHKFFDDKYEERRGSELDVKNLTELFTQMGYKVLRPNIDMTKGQTFKALDDFRDNEALADCDSVVIIIMSHGRKEHFYTSDNNRVEYNEVLDKFSNAQCKLLIDKPKIFIFQCCRGSLADMGVEPMTYAYESSKHFEDPDVRTDGVPYGIAQSIARIPTLSDMFLVYAAIEGFASHRNPMNGSWLIHALCQEFMANAHCKDFASLMNGVSARVKEFVSVRGRRQNCEWTNKGVTKAFYFNPCNRDVSPLGSFENFSELRESLVGHSHVLDRRCRHWSDSRSPTPDSYSMSTSSSLTNMKSRHSSGTSVASNKEQDVFSPRSPTTFSVGPTDTTACWENNSNRHLEENSMIVAIDVVDTLKGQPEDIPPRVRRPPISEDYKNFRRNRTSTEEKKVKISNRLKRELSIPSESDALRGVNQVTQYLQGNNGEYLVSILNPILDLINQSKTKNKRPKKEFSTQ